MIDLLISDLGKLPDGVDPYDITGALLDPDIDLIFFHTKDGAQYERYRLDTEWKHIPPRDGFPAPDDPCKGMHREFVFGSGETVPSGKSLAKVLL